MELFLILAKFLSAIEVKYIFQYAVKRKICVSNLKTYLHWAF